MQSFQISIHFQKLINKEKSNLGEVIDIDRIINFLLVVYIKGARPANV